MELGAALPVPAPDTPLQEVLKFRDDYQDERTRLRVALHRLLRELQDIDDPDLARAAVKQEIAEAVGDVEAALRGRKLAWVKHGLWGGAWSRSALWQGLPRLVLSWAGRSR